MPKAAADTPAGKLDVSNRGRGGIHGRTTLRTSGRRGNDAPRFRGVAGTGQRQLFSKPIHISNYRKFSGKGNKILDFSSGLAQSIPPEADRVGFFSARP